MINDLLLLSKNDIPLISAELSIHQPTIKEIAYIGEEQFYSGCNLLNFSKEVFLTDEDKINSKDISDFEMLLKILSDKKSVQLKKCRVSVLLVLSLLFPDYQLSLKENGIYLQSFKVEEKDKIKTLNKENFEEFKLILREMFCLNPEGEEMNYNPSGPMAEKIAKQLKERHKKLANNAGLNGEDKKIAILSRYVSILAVGEHKDMNTLLDYTVYQLFDEFKRFRLIEEFNTYIQAKMAGAKDLQEPDDWMKNIH